MFVVTSKESRGSVQKQSSQSKTASFLYLWKILESTKRRKTPLSVHWKR